MQQLERRKGYKASEPLATINAARQRLAACDLFTTEYHHSYPIPGVHCCRVLLGDEDISGLNIGSNGKGMTARYALASAYGEILERLQNSILFPLRQLKFATRRYLGGTPGNAFRERLEKEDLVLDYHYGPDEVYLDTAALTENCADVLADMLGIDGAARQKAYLREAFGAEEVGCLPYYSVLEERVRLLPIKLIWNLCGTNGMCAGNTPAEALIQGISEVFERFAIRTIYQRNVTPPTVPDGYFRGTAVLDRLERLAKEAGITATVKDCSLGMGLPVLGLLLVEGDTGRYTFHVGADPCPITALERCLTEIYQGTPQYVAARFHSRQDGAPADMTADRLWRTAYYDTTSGGLGKWPESIFAREASYPFAGFAHPVAVSDADDLAYLAAVVKSLGCSLFIRDVSYLGFPSYQIYIPGMSEMDFIFEESDFPDWMAIVRQQTTLLNLGRANEGSIAGLADAVAKTAALALPVSFEPRRWFLSNVNPALQQLTKDYILTLLYCRIADYRRAANCLASFMQSAAAQSGPMLFYRALHSYLQAKAEALPKDEIEALLADSYGETMTRKVLAEFSDPAGGFSGADWPACFDCDACKTASSCRYFAILRRVKAVQRVFQANQPRQGALARLFAGSDKQR